MFSLSKEEFGGPKADYSLSSHELKVLSQERERHDLIFGKYDRTTSIIPSQQKRKALPQRKRRKCCYIMPSMSSPICLCLTYATIGLVIFLPAINAGVHGYNRGPDEAPEYSHVDMVISKREIDHDHEGITNIFTAENSTSSHKTHCEMLKAGDHSPIPSSPLLSPRVARRKRPCSKGHSGDYSCHGVDLLSSMSLWELTISHGNGRDNANDIWGWTDMRSGREFVLVGLGRGTAFVEITNPINPTNLGVLPGTDWHDANPWRDIKVYQNHALIVSEYNHHGMQVSMTTESRLRRTNLFITFLIIVRDLIAYTDPGV